MIVSFCILYSVHSVLYVVSFICVSFAAAAGIGMGMGGGALPSPLQHFVQNNLEINSDMLSS